MTLFAILVNHESISGVMILLALSKTDFCKKKTFCGILIKLSLHHAFEFCFIKCSCHVEDLVVA